MNELDNVSGLQLIACNTVLKTGGFGQKLIHKKSQELRYIPGNQLNIPGNQLN